MAVCGCGALARVSAPRRHAKPAVRYHTAEKAQRHGNCLSNVFRSRVASQNNGTLRCPCLPIALLTQFYPLALCRSCVTVTRAARPNAGWKLSERCVELTERSYAYSLTSVHIRADKITTPSCQQLTLLFPPGRWPPYCNPPQRTRDYPEGEVVLGIELRTHSVKAAPVDTANAEFQRPGVSAALVRSRRAHFTFIHRQGYPTVSHKSPSHYWRLIICSPFHIPGNAVSGECRAGDFEGYKALRLAWSGGD